MWFLQISEELLSNMVPARSYLSVSANRREL